MCKNRQKMNRKVEHVKNPKMDSQDLTPEGFGSVRGIPGDPWEPLKYPQTPEIPSFPRFREFSLNSPVGPYWALRALKVPGQCPTLSDAAH